MKIMFTILFLIVVSLSVHAQFEVYEDFEGAWSPVGWTFTNDGAYKWQLDEGMSFAYGNQSAKHAYHGSQNQNSWMISPAVDLSGTTSPVLLFADRGNYVDYHVFYEISISDNVNMIGATQLYSTVAAEDTWTQRQIDLSAYNDGVYYIGFHYTGLDADDWWIDNIAIGEPAANDAKLLSIDSKKFYEQGNIDISGTVVNFGQNQITSLDINYQIDGGSVITESLSGLTLNSSDTYSFTFSTQWAATPGTYNLQVWLSNMNGNGNDDDIGNDLQNQSMYIATQSVTNMPLYEEFTSSTCPPCATFNKNVFSPFMNSHPYDIAVVKYQMSWPSPGDPYYTAEGGTRRAYYGVNGVPDIYVGGIDGETNLTSVNALYNSETVKPTFFDLGATFEVTGNDISVDIDIIPYITVPNFKVHIAVIEKLTTGNVGNNGETSFKHVMMKMLPDADGTLVSFTEGVIENITESFDMSTTNVEEMDDLAVLVFIQNDQSKEVFQSAYATPPPAAYFNPSDGATDTHIDTDIVIDFASAMRLADDSEINSGNIADFIHLTDPSKADIPFTATIDEYKMKITIDPDDLLSASTNITISIDDVEIENTNDITLSATSATFTTGTETSTSEIFNRNISVYPNPAKNFINIVDAEGSFISILDLTGKEVFNTKISENNERVNVSFLNNGSYILRFNKKGQITLNKINIQK